LTLGVKTISLTNSKFYFEPQYTYSAPTKFLLPLGKTSYTISFTINTYIMKLSHPFILFLLVLLVLCPAKKMFAQEEKPASTLTVTVTQDAAFGFYPLASGSFGLTPKLSLTFYSIFWTNPSFANAGTGTDWFLETGAGIGFTPAEGLLLNPAVGFTHGKLLSGGQQGVIADGMVPNLAAFYNKGRFESEFYGAYYKSLRKEGTVTTDYFLGWVYSGIVLHKHISVGAHYEQFRITRMTNDNAKSLYHWLGGYLKFTLEKGYFLRFSAGKNFTDTKSGGYPEEFYRLGLFLPFL